jgi:hypothetical protein
MGANTKAAMALFDKAEKDKLTPNKTPLTSLGTENSGNARANDSGYNAMIMAHGGADDYEGLSNITEGDAKKIRENLNYLPVVGAVASGIDLAAAISTGDGNKINNAVGKLSAELAANYLGGKAIGYAGREIIGSKYYIDAMKKIKDKIGETAFSKVKDKINHNLAKKDNYLPEFLDDFKVSKTATPPRSYTPPVSIAKARNTLAPTTPTNYAVSPIVRKTPTTHTSTNRISSNNASQPADTPKTNIAPNTTTNVASPSDNIIKEKISETIKNTQKEFIGKELKALGLNKVDAKKHLLENGYSDVDADKMLLKTYGIPSFGNKQNVVSTTNSQTGNIPQSKPKYTIGSLADDMENGIAKLSDAPKKHVSVVMLKRKIQANKLAKESIEKQKSTVLGIDLKNNAIKAPAANVASPSDKIMGVEPIATKYTYTTPTDKLLSNNIEKTPVVRKKRVKNVLPANEPTLWDIPNTSDVPIKTLPKKVVKDKPVAKEIVAKQKDELDPLISKVGIETPKEIKSVIPAGKPTQIRIYKGVDAVNEQGQKWMQQIDKRLIKGESGVLSKAINSEDAVLSQVGKNYKAEIDRKIAFLKSHSDDTPLGIEYKNAHKNATSALKNSDLSLNDIDKIIGESISTENRKNAMILFNKKEPIPKEIMSQGIAPKAKTALVEMPNDSTVVKKKNHFSFDDITQNEKEFADRIENGIKSNNDVFGMIEKSNVTPEFKEFANKYKAQKWQLEQNLEQLSKGETLMAQEAKAVLDALPTDKSFSVNEIQDAIKKNVSSRNVKFFENKVKSGGKWDEKDALDYIDASKDILSANGYETTRAHKSLLLDYDKSLSNSDKEFAKKPFTAEQKEELKSYGAYLKGAVNNLSKYRNDKKIGTSVDKILNALDTKGSNIPLSYENITKLIKEMVHPSNKKAVMDLIIKSNK